MEIGAIFLILALVLVVAAVLSRPFLRAGGEVEEQPISAEQEKAELVEDHQYSALLAERDRLLNALQELDFDAALGKVPAEDYPVQREALLTAGAEVLRKLDEIEGKKDSGDESVRMEEAAAARRADAPADIVPLVAEEGEARPALIAEEASPPVISTPADDELEGMIASHRRQRKEKSAGFCPRCGRPVQKSDRFCPRCGANL